MRYSIVIPTYNHCNDLLKPCIESIINYTNMADIELIISANGCTDNTKEYIQVLQQSYSNIKLVWSDSPSGYPKATNDGIKVATCDKIVLLNNDCQLLEQKQNEWLTILEKPFNDFDNCGVSCIIKEYSKVMKRHFAIFFCVMIDRKVFDEIGLLNEEFGTGSGEDMEFCIKAQDAGYEIHEVFEKTPLDEKYFTGQFPIYHYGEGTVHDKTLVPDWDSIFLGNAFKLAKKYNDDWKNMKKTNVKKIGVITPVHNDIEHFFNAINSVKSQTLGNVIHYIFDDGSTDGLEKAMEELKDDQTIKYIRETDNHGQSHARNVCIEHAKNDGCEYVAFLDSDDFWYPEHLERNLDYHYNNDVDITYSKPEYTTSDGSVVYPHNIPDPDIFVGKQLYHNNFIWISSVFAQIYCFINNKFDGTINSTEDWDMWIRLFEQGFSFNKIPDTSIRYLVRDSSQASKGKEVINLFRTKHELLPQLKLHLACGHDYTEGYINVDLYAPEDAKCDVRFDVIKLPYPDNSVDEIKAFHIIEHFHFFEIEQVLKEWYRVLKPGGRLWLETPDFLETCRSFVEGSPVMPLEEWRVLLYGHFFAHPWVPGQTHKFLFTEEQLRTNLGWAGFKKVKRLPPASGYVMNHTVHLFLNVEAIK